PPPPRHTLFPYTTLFRSQTLNYNSLGVQPTQGWTTHHVVFNSLSNSTVNVYFGVWGGTTGSLWWDNATIEEIAFLNLIRRPGAPDRKSTRLNSSHDQISY